jgi:hypothetical protein
LFFISSRFIISQNALISERPGQALSPNCLQKGSVQVQMGLDFMKYQKKEYGIINLMESNQKNLHNTVIRFGLGEKFEINTTLNYIPINSSLQDPLVGFKTSILKNKKHDIAIQYNSSIRILREEEFINSVKVITSHSFTDKLGLGINTGIQFSPELEEFSTNYVLSFSFNPFNKFGMVLEGYGTYDDSFKSFWDIGFGYLITPLLQVDTYFGGHNSFKELDVFISGGLTYRFDCKNYE